MKKIVQRLLMFIIGFPIVVFIVIFLPYRNHLIVNVIVTLLSALGAIEFSQMIGKNRYKMPPWEAAILGALAPLAMTFSVSFSLNGELIPTAFIFGATLLMASRVFSHKNGFMDTIDRVTVGLSTMIYPSLFMLWIIRMSLLSFSTIVIMAFLLTVFANDSLAWVFGMLFGKGNRGISAASPNKSLAGFIGGITGSILIGLLAVTVVPKAFTPTLVPKYLSGLILGSFTGLAAIIGDLAESTLKRSAEIKDSGSIMPGRGGILDSIDSVALAAPVFYGLYWVLF